MQDAQDVMDMLVKVQNDQGDMEPDDPQVRREEKKLWGRITLGRLVVGRLPIEKKSFETYLPYVAPPPQIQHLNLLLHVCCTIGIAMHKNCIAHVNLMKICFIVMLLGVIHDQCLGEDV